MHQYQTASLWKRLLSTLYDLLILGAVSLLYGALVTSVSTLAFGNTATDFKPNATGVFVQVGWVLTITGFYCFFWLRVGQTVAMKAWRLKLISLSGNPLSLSTCILRCVLGLIGFFCVGLGYLWSLIDKDGYALHDRLSNTRVIQLPKGQ